MRACSVSLLLAPPPPTTTTETYLTVYVRANGQTAEKPSAQVITKVQRVRVCVRAPRCDGNEKPTAHTRSRTHITINSGLTCCRRGTRKQITQYAPRVYAVNWMRYAFKSSPENAIYSDGSTIWRIIGYIMASARVFLRVYQSPVAASCA